MISLEATIKGSKNIIRGLNRARARMLKAENTAVRVEGVRLMNLLRREIRAGAPGGRHFAKLSTLARRSGSPKRLRPDRPLYAMSNRIGYDDHNRASPARLSIGFVGRASSETWRKLAKLHQEGLTFSSGSRLGTRNTGMWPRKRAYFRWVASKLSARATGRKHLLIKKSTRQFSIPPRPIIDPFWRAHRAEALRNIVANTRRKLRGERI